MGWMILMSENESIRETWDDDLELRTKNKGLDMRNEYIRFSG